MITLQQARRIAPELNHLSDRELQRILDLLYALADLAIDTYLAEQPGSKPGSGILAEKQ